MMPPPIFMDSLCQFRNNFYLCINQNNIHDEKNTTILTHPDLCGVNECSAIPKNMAHLHTK